MQSLKFCTLGLLCIFGGNALAVELNSLFSDNMIMQRNVPVKIYGKSTTNATVSVSFASRTIKVKVNAKTGKWLVKFPKMSAGGPYNITVKDSRSSKTINNILIGEVWVCSGQSNMKFELKYSKNGKESASLANDKLLRVFTVAKLPTVQPMDNCTGKWNICTPKTAGDFSAVAYYFGKSLRKQLNVPVGLIVSSWGGTGAESWMSIEGLNSVSLLRHRVSGLKRDIAKAIKSPRNLKKDDSKWMLTDYNDQNWKRIKLPHWWDYVLYPIEYDGVIWARKTINIPKSWAAKKLSLSLSKIDDYETTYFNGKEVGKEVRWSHKRRIYDIPASIVKSGKAVIAVRTVKNGWGGIFGKKQDMYLALANDSKKRIELAGEWHYQPSVLKFKTISPRLMSSLYNGMINPLIKYPVKGVIWYQGEANANPNTAYTYRQIFPGLIRDWRKKWEQGDFPFYYVQLASFSTRLSKSWAILRESQLKTLALANTGMAVAIDVGEAKDIHPKNKKDVGERLALWALAKDYDKKLEYSGPLYKKMKRNGSKIIISFSHANGLYAKNGKLKGFEIAGKDKKFSPANAKISGSKVIVSSPGVKHPAIVRYAWKGYPTGCNLYNQEKLPASPFRTDK